MRIAVIGFARTWPLALLIKLVELLSFIFNSDQGQSSVHSVVAIVHKPLVRGCLLRIVVKLEFNLSWLTAHGINFSFHKVLVDLIVPVYADCRGVLSHSSLV